MYLQVQNIVNGQLSLATCFTKKGNHYNSEAETWNDWQIPDTNPNHLYQLIKTFGAIFQKEFKSERTYAFFYILQILFNFEHDMWI